MYEGMSLNSFDELRRYYQDNSVVWRDFQFNDCHDFSEIKKNIASLPNDAAHNLLGDSLGYLSAAENEIEIYKEALRRLKQGDDPDDVDRWLDRIGFPIQHNQLGRALVNRISQLYQNILNVINNFIQSTVRVLNMNLSEVEFTFSASPSVGVTFA